MARNSLRWLWIGVMMAAAGCGGASSPATSPEKVVRQKLRQVVTLQVDEPLKDALHRIGKKHGLKIEIDESVRKTKGAKSSDLADDWVALRVRNIRLGSALHHLLRPLGLTYDLNGAAVHVTTPDGLQKAALIAFLKTLTDKDFITDPRFADLFLRAESGEKKSPMVDG